jgi:prepilin-type N-terminal cleavage/methylation domain-containing protein
MLKDMKAKLKSREGFSLVELIVVIAIMVILVAMLLPSVAGLIGQANQATGASGASSLYTAATAAVTANAGVQDVTKRETAVKGTDANVSVYGNLGGDFTSEAYVYTDSEYSKVICVVLKGTDGNYYVNPTNYADGKDVDGNTSDANAAKGINSSATPVNTPTGAVSFQVPTSST